MVLSLPLHKRVLPLLKKRMGSVCLKLYKTKTNAQNGLYFPTNKDRRQPLKKKKRQLIFFYVTYWSASTCYFKHSSFAYQ